MKLNAVAILREGARVQRVEDEEEKRLASLEAGEKDASEFTRWQEEMKQREAAEKLADIQRKHLVSHLYVIHIAILLTWAVMQTFND